MADPGEVRIGKGQRLQHLRGVGHHPRGIGGMRVLAAQPQVGPLCHGVEVWCDFVTVGDWEFLRRMAREA